jgi:hypothetical protein
LPAEVATIAAKAQGYATGRVAKNHFGTAEGALAIVTAPSSPATKTFDNPHRIVCKRINAR